MNVFRALRLPKLLPWLAAILAIVALGAYAAAPVFAATAQVSIVEPNYDNTDSWTFEPNVITVKTGDTVVWTNNGQDPHDVTADDKSFISGPEGNMNPGDTFQFTFTKAGTFTYICAAHPWMNGKVVVQ